MSGYEIHPVPSAALMRMGDTSTEPASVYSDLLAHGVTFLESIWPLVGNELPPEVHQRIVGPIDRLGDPSERTDATNLRASRVMDVHEGLLAAQYHRDNIDRIERELVRRLRQVYAEGSWPQGGSAASRMPVIAHEYMAYVFAARRTLEYLARAVSGFFGQDVHKIKNLASGLTHGKPADLAEEARRISTDVIERFPELLTRPGERHTSDRDRAAHQAPVAPASLSVVFFRGGPVGITFNDDGRGLLPPTDVFDPEATTRDEPVLTQAIDARLGTLHEFCGDLIEVGVQAEERRIASAA